jgi:hypothetical protein
MIRTTKQRRDQMKDSKRLRNTIESLKNQICTAYYANDFKRCNSLLNRKRVVERFLLQIDTYNFFKKGA